MLKRAITAVVLSALAVVILLYAPWWAFSVVMALAVLVGVGELLRMLTPYSHWDRVLLTIAVLVAVFGQLVSTRLGIQWRGVIPWFAAWFFMLFALAVSQILRPDPISEAGRRIASHLFILTYLGFTLPLILSLQLAVPTEQGGWRVLFAMIITFGGDTGAYLLGKAIGRHKLAPKVSPNKTIEGYAGALILSTVGVFLCRAFMPGMQVLTVWDALILGIGGATVGVLGDLLESLLKRAGGVKDSGNLIPGHGGVLDRIDALLFVAPSVFFYLRIRGFC